MIADIISTVLNIRELMFIITGTSFILLSFHYLATQIFLKKKENENSYSTWLDIID